MSQYMPNSNEARFWLLVPPQMELCIHRPCRTSGALFEGEFSLTGADWAHAGSNHAVVWIHVAWKTRGRFGSIWNFDESWTGARGLVGTGWRNKALDRAWDESGDGHQVEISRHRAALRIGRNGGFGRKRAGGSYRWLCSIYRHFRCFCGVGVFFCTTDWRVGEWRGRRGCCWWYGSRLDRRGWGAVLDLGRL